MLRDQGWTYEKGLGIEEQGGRHPIPIRMKNDKLGIGMKRQKLEREESKVTVTSKSYFSEYRTITLLPILKSVIYISLQEFRKEAECERSKKAI